MAFEGSENLRDQDAEFDARRDLHRARRVELPVRWTWLKSHSTAFNGTHDSVSFHESDIGALRSLRVNAYQGACPAGWSYPVVRSTAQTPQARSSSWSGSVIGMPLKAALSRTCESPTKERPAIRRVPRGEVQPAGEPRQLDPPKIHLRKPPRT
jgi:hypothetical protein